MISFLLQIKLQDLGLKTFYFLSSTNSALVLGSDAKILHCFLVVVQNRVVSNLNREAVRNRKIVERNALEQVHFLHLFA